MKLVKSVATLLATVSLLVKSEAELKSNNSNQLQGSLCSKNSDCPSNSVCRNNKCHCNQGYSGDKCDLVEPKVRCLPDRIEVLINKNWAKNKANVDSYEQIYLGNNSENKNCQSFPHPEDENTYILKVSEDSTCGTKVSRNTTTSDYVYTNEVLSSSLSSVGSSEDGSNIDINISRSNMPIISLVSWQCVYKSKYDVSYTDKDTNTVVPIKISDKVVLPNKSEIKIQSFSDDSFASSQLQTSTIYDGDSIFLELSTSNKNKNFDIQKCTLRMVEGEADMPLKGSEDKASIFGLKHCENSEYLAELFPNTKVLENTKKDLKIAYKINRDDFLNSNQGSDTSIDPQVYIRCEVTEEEIDEEKCAGKSARKISKRETQEESNTEQNNNSNSEQFVIENGPFTIKSAESKLVINPRNPQSTNTQLDNSENNSNQASDVSSDDEEHSLLQPQPDTQAIAELLNMLDKVKDSVINKADAVQLEAVLQHLQRASEDIKPLVEVTSEYSLTEFERPGPIYNQLGSDGDYITVNDMSEDAEKAQRRVRTMVVLAISIGVIFICLIALPILFVFYRNNVASKVIKDSNDEEKGNGKSANEGNANAPSEFKQPNQIITIDTGLNVDHALHFVEYTDHIHDLVFEGEDNDQYPTNMWIKQISTDTQSIDISNQDPIKMTYTNSLYTKNAHNPNNNIICSQDIHRTSSNSSSKSSINSFTVNTKKESPKELPVPSYVTMQTSANNNIKRKKSFRLAGVKIPSEIINTIMPNQKTSKPYKTNNNNIVSEASCRGNHNPVFE